MKFSLDQSKNLVAQVRPRSPSRRTAATGRRPYPAARSDMGKAQADLLGVPLPA